MAMGTITRAEFDERLARSTERMRQKRLTLEARASELEDLIGRYSSVLERLEAVADDSVDAAPAQRSDLRDVLAELAKYTAAVAASM